MANTMAGTLPGQGVSHDRFEERAESERTSKDRAKKALEVLPTVPREIDADLMRWEDDGGALPRRN